MKNTSVWPIRFWKTIAALIFAMSFTGVCQASPASDAMFQELQTKGAQKGSPQQGEKLWTKVEVVKNQERSCTGCHGKDLSKQGKHLRTKKVIQPMAASVNNERFTELKKIKKWFKRNCKWAWGRECTPQEQADILAYLLSI